MIKYDEYGMPYEDNEVATTPTQETQINIPQDNGVGVTVSPVRPQMATNNSYDTPDMYQQGQGNVVTNYTPQTRQEQPTGPFSSEQLAWLGQANTQDPYILNRMPGNKPTVDYFKTLEDQEIARRLKFPEQMGQPQQPQQPQIPKLLPGTEGQVTTVPEPRVETRPLPPINAQEMRFPPSQPNKFGFNQNQFNEDVMKRESGGNPNIGYHYEVDPATGRRKSTAFGAYGITEPTYKDIQRNDPYFANKPLSSLSLEEQTKAQNILTEKVGERLSQLGVQPTYGNISASQFLGADGLARYLKTGEISEAAQKANGGYERTKQIIDSRLATAPTGETGPPIARSELPEPTPYTRPEPKVMEILKRGEDGALYSIVADKEGNFTPVDRRIASNELKTNIENQQNIEKAQAKLQQLQTDPSKTTDLARDLAKERGEGSWFKAILLSALGFGTQANLEFEKLGVGAKNYGSAQVGDKSYHTVTTPSGRLLRAYDEEGNLVDQKTFAKISAQSIGAGGKWTTSAELLQDENGNIYKSQQNDKGQTRTVNVSTNEVYGGKQPLRKVTDESAIKRAQQEQEFYRQRRVVDLNTRLAGMDYQSKLKAVEQFNQNEVNAGRSVLSPVELQNIGIVPPNAPAVVGGQAQAPTIPQPQVGQTPQAAPTAPVAPQAAPGQVSQVPVAPPIPQPQVGVTGRPTVAATKQGEKAVEREAKISESARTRIVDAAADVVSGQATILSKVSNIDQVIPLLEAGKVNLGSISSYQLPGEKAIERYLNTEDAQNTRRVLQLTKDLSIQGIKALGANPSNADLQFITAYQPDENWSPEAVKDWLNRARKGLEDSLVVARKQIETNGRYEPTIPTQQPAPTPAPTTNTEKTINGVTYIYDGKGWKRK